MICLRAARALFGFVAIGCLGCDALDPIFDQLIGGPSAVASCASMSGAQGQDNGAPASMSEAATPSHGASMCSCDHCVAVQQAGTEVALAPQEPPAAVVRIVGSALRLDREPLVPPPQA